MIRHGQCIMFNNGVKNGCKVVQYECEYELYCGWCSNPAAENGAKTTLSEPINTLLKANNTTRQQNVQNVHLAMKEP